MCSPPLLTHPPDIEQKEQGDCGDEGDDWREEEPEPARGDKHSLEAMTTFATCACAKPEKGLCVDQIEDAFWDVKLAGNLITKLLALEDPPCMFAVQDDAAYPVHTIVSANMH